MRKIPGNLEQWEPIQVQWVDSTGSVDDWEEIPSAGLTPYDITTIGQVYSVGDDSITLVFSLVESTQVVGGYITIPAVAITGLVRLVAR